MDILLSIVYIIAGLAVLAFGGDILVNGAVSIARKWGISEVVIGLTIVAVGTSMPELVVSILASISGQSELAIGNILGTNIVNYFFILGLIAFMVPVTLTSANKWIDLPISTMSAVLLLILTSDMILEGAAMNSLGRIDGIVLVFLAILYIIFSIKYDFLAEKPVGGEVEKVTSIFKAWLWVIGGCIVLYFGGNVLIEGSVNFARIMGLSESFIGLTIIAIGTSAPELITGIIAAKKGKAGIAVGNIIGSSTLNILIILGLSAIVHPLPFLSGSYFDIILNILAPITVIILFHMRPRRVLDRPVGIILMSLYAVYLLLMIFFRMH